MVIKSDSSSIPRTEVRLTVGLVLITLLVINAGGWIYYSRAREYMERESRERLSTVARMIAAQIDRERVLAFEPGDEGMEEYRLEQEKLECLRDEAGLDNVYLFAPYQGSLLDTRPGVAIGDRHPLTDMDSDALAPLWGGEAVGLSLNEIAGEWFQSAAAPILKDGEIRAIVGVDAGADFLNNLRFLHRALLLTALLSLVVAAGIGFYVMRSTRRLVLLQSEIKNAEKLAALGRLTAGLAHEIRNPLAIIRASSELLHEDEPDDIDRSYAAEIIGEVDRLSDLLGSFLDFARPVHDDRKRVDLVGLAEETLCRMETELGENGIRLRRSFPPGKIHVKVEPVRIEQVLVNLLMNARDAMSDRGGTIEVSLLKSKRMRPSAVRPPEAESRHGYAEVCVSDQGEGIPDEIRDKLFDPFFTTKKRGTGLGLSIVHGIVRSHGGYLFVESGRKSGTTMGFGLPV